MLCCIMSYTRLNRLKIQWLSSGEAEHTLFETTYAYIVLGVCRPFLSVAGYFIFCCCCNQVQLAIVYWHMKSNRVLSFQNTQYVEYVFKIKTKKLKFSICLFWYFLVSFNDYYEFFIILAEKVSNYLTIWSILYKICMQRSWNDLINWTDSGVLKIFNSQEKLYAIQKSWGQYT